MRRQSLRVALFLIAAATPWRGDASFHLMQIEQLIGGVDGDTSAQAIQLRMRTFGQAFVNSGRLRAFDASGQNPILLFDMTRDVANGELGDRVLLATPNFGNYTAGALPFVADFTLANLIPASYLAAGKITYEDDFGSILWAIAFGGANYTGPNSGTLDNDSDGNFGPAFPSALSINSRRALQFRGSASDPSTTNAADYALTTGAAIFTNNSRQSFTVVPEPSAFLLCASGMITLTLRRRPQGRGHERLA
jgi:hypothetical protein